MKESFQIEKPTSDIDIVTAIIKYIVLGITLFLASWIAIPLLISQNRPYRLNKTFEILFSNPLMSSILISVLVIGFLIYRSWKKYRVGEVYKIYFDDMKQKLIVNTVNTANNKEKVNVYSYSDITYKLNQVTDPLFGYQRILQISEENKNVHSINIDRTAWCRNEHLEELIEKIKIGHNTA
ncbi:hypothetical protein [Salegentibacter maritimus]|uniref:DUF304 domain-containing protein n=1 Tax=Salegentibacter maritimus TaxID=2794347 RepID=A0ABS0TIN7_9FLAO|nr:hypothetical protein [Salegentibacter maritimus]MBI6120116.1 hypothetical protein [Salegentibacter maritimus]